MKTKYLILTVFLLLATGILAAQTFVPVPAAPQERAIMLTGATIHTGTGEVIENGVIAFDQGKITAVGKTGETALDRSAHEVIDVSGKHVYPGLILPVTGLGLMEISSVDVTMDIREFGSVNPGARSVVAYNTDSHLIPPVRSNGICLAQVVPAGGQFAGTSSIMQLDAWNWEDAVYKMDEGMHLNWPAKPGKYSSRGGDMYARFFGRSSSRTPYPEQLTEIKKILEDTRAYAREEDHEHENLKLKALEGIFDGSKTLYLYVSGGRAIMESILFLENLGVKRIVLVGAGEDAWMVKDFLKEHDIPVFLAHVHSMPAYDHSDTRMPFKLARMFLEEGILTGITYSNPTTAYNLPFMAGQSVALGLDKEEALKAITLNNARILGIDDRAGSLEKGKDAHIIVSAGDLLDIKSNHIEHEFIQGRKIDLDNKHKMLYRRFQKKYERISR